MRGMGWGREHSTVNYVFTYPMAYLYYYHLKVMKEMKRRKYKVNNELWYSLPYRGLRLGMVKMRDVPGGGLLLSGENKILYKEHNKKYLQKCLELLKNRIMDEPHKYKDDCKQVNIFFRFYNDRRISNFEIQPD